MVKAGGEARVQTQKGVVSRDCSTVTGADLRIARQGQGESTRDPLHDSELAPDSANGSIPSLIAWTVQKPPGNAATVSNHPGKTPRPAPKAGLGVPGAPEPRFWPRLAHPRAPRSAASRG